MTKLLKSALVALAVAFTPVYADTIGVLRNKAGGLIVLTDLREGCPRHPGAAYATTDSSNRTMWGCWYTDDLMVHIEWHDGDRTSYLLENFTINSDNIRRLRERRQGRGGANL